MREESEVLNYLRKNVSLERIHEVEKLLRSEADLNKYFTETFMESIYRAHKGSYKIDMSKRREKNTSHTSSTSFLTSQKSTSI